MSHPEIKAPTTDTCQCGKPAHEIRTGDKGNKYSVCFPCAQDWQAVLVRKEDAPQVAELGRSLYTAAAQQAGYLTAATPACVQNTRPRIKATPTEADRRRILDQVRAHQTAGTRGGLGGHAWDAFHNYLAELVAAADDPQARINRLAELLTHENTRTAADCWLYPGLCTAVDGEQGDQVDDHGRHYDHASRTITVPGLEVEGDPEIWAEFSHVSDGTPVIGFMGADLTTAQARAKAQQIRQFADDLDTLADQVDTAVTATDTPAGGNR